MPHHAPLRIFSIVTMAVLTACALHRAPHGAATADVTHGADAQHGKTVYEQQCQACHGAGGTAGPIGPVLHGERARRSYESVRRFVLDPDAPMPKLFPSRMTAADVRDVSAYVESL
ncbi:MAG: cytochrome c [Candidatus Baltobacteraceae bacterium]